MFDPVLILSIAGVVLLAAALVLADRRHRLLPVSTAILGSLAVGWFLAARAVAVDYRDADGFVDCWSYCTAFQTAIGATLFHGPLAALILLVVSAVLLAARHRGPRAS